LVREHRKSKKARFAAQALLNWKDMKMKANLHPDYHQITVIMTDGTEFVTRSTYGEAGAKLHLDIDPKVHPAWTGLHRMVDRGGQLDKFNKRFAGLSTKKDAAKTDEVAAAEPVEKIKLTTTASTAKKSKKKA
jgi:large subunit ribosomal protein L31